MPHSLQLIRPVLLCGGIGTRLAPLSTPENPKPFLKLLSNYSMLQQTALRVKAAKAPLILCSDIHANRAMRHMYALDIQPENILREPVSRNTAPAAALAAKYFEAKEDEVLVFLPCDHQIIDLEAFELGLLKALPYAEQGDFVLFGETPTAPDVGYGYIQAAMDKGREANIQNIIEFHEKPDLQTAIRYLKSGYVWNCGIVMVSARTLKAAFQTYCPEIWHIVEKCNFPNPDKFIFEAMPNISLDYALLEHIPNKKLCPFHIGWRDIGTLDRLEATA